MTVQQGLLGAAISVALLAGGSCCAAAGTPLAPLRDWPRVASALPKDAAMERQVARIVAGMTLAQKVGQMTQAELKSVTPADVTRYYLGSVLNGGGSWPGGDKHASAAGWVAQADAFYVASMATDMAIKVPVVWGIDAMHGNSNVYGATLFPHNIGLGAAHNPALVRKMAVATAKAVLATGINWVFAPTLAVVQDVRWGRTYESFSQDPALVRRYAGAYVTGLQGAFRDDGNVIATAKHYVGDGGTDQGKDRGVNRASLRQMINIHGAGYYSALAAGAQTVMASFHSWNDVAAGVDHGKVHGSRYLLTEVLKDSMGFDGFVVSDWDAIGEVPGCTTSSCPQAINAGIDMAMVPNDWKAFIANTIAQVESGQIPMARINDAVSRILRVKLRAGMFSGKPPSANPYAGQAGALLARGLARQAVRESLVLLKNNGGALPLTAGKKILVVGKSADSMANQTGGWSLTWQGTDNANTDFPQGDTLLAAIRAANGDANVTYSPSAQQVDLAAFDSVIAVIGETPYAEGDGDIGPAGSLRLSSRHPGDLAVLRAVAGKGKPVVTILLSGRPLYVNDLLNLSDAFVAAWLPGTEGQGVTDVLFRTRHGGAAHDFKGRLPFSWPSAPCMAGPASAGSGTPLFALGYGLRYASAAAVPQLDVNAAPGGCGKTNLLPVFDTSDRATFPLFIADAERRLALGADLNNAVELPGLRVETAQINTQQDAKLATWTGPARLEAHAARPMALPAYATDDGALQFDVVVHVAPQGPVLVAMDCGVGCGASVNLQASLQAAAGKGKQTFSIPLACFTAKGLRLDAVDTPFSMRADKPLVAAFTNIRIAGGAASREDALACAALEPAR